MTSHSQSERTVGAMELQPVSQKFEVLSRKVVGQALDYLYDTSGEPPVPSSAIVHKNAYSRGEENERDYFVDELTKMLDVDVDDALNRFEIARKETEGGDVAALHPWMLSALGIDTGGEPVSVEGCTIRAARLNFDYQPPLTLRELEMPITVTDNETGQAESRVARFMWMTAD